MPVNLTCIFFLILATLAAAPFLRARDILVESGKNIWRSEFSFQESQFRNRVPNSHIKSFQVFGKSNGIAFTRDALYRTDDNGESWVEIDLQKDRSQTISHVYFSSVSDGWLLLADSGRSTLEIRQTSDGGNSWMAHPVVIEPDELRDADLEDALLLLFMLSPEWQLIIPLQTSSNFRGSLVYTSRDNWQTWEFRSRRVGLNTPLEEGKAEVVSGGWMLRTDGVCLAAKTGCLQETRLYRARKEITPPQIKALARIEKENARLEVENAPLFSLPPGGTTRISLNRGFDMCNAPTAAQMQTWWNFSPLYDMNIYMSGRNRACSAQPNLSAAWVDQVTAMGWGLIPTVVGYQSPCTASTTTVKLSYDPPTAETQGRGEADIAVAAAANLGLTTGSILYYDMERYDETVSTPGCRTATTAFLKGWTDRIKELGYKSGVYGSPRNAIDDWQFMPAASRMEAVWMARWDNIPSVWTYLSFSNFPTNVWADHQRIKQWQAPHNETWGGVTFNIDGDNSDGPVAGVVVPKNKNADFDGDGKSDVSVFRPDTGVWYYLFSSNGSAPGVGFGAAGDIPVPGDYDGDGKTDAAVFRPADSVWHMLTKAGNYSSRQFGASGDIPAAADFNGDGKTDIAVFRPSNGVWYIANSDSIGSYTYVQFGQSGDKPATGDYDGDGKADIAIFRPAGATGAEWWVLKSSGGVFATQFGSATDKAAPLDYTGDGKADIAFWRPSTGEWFILRSEDYSYFAFPFGTGGDVPAPGDFDGDGKADAAVFRPSNGVWYLLRSQAGFAAVQFGLANDRPVENAYLPQ